MECWNIGRRGITKEDITYVDFYPLNPTFHPSTIPAFQLWPSKQIWLVISNQKNINDMAVVSIFVR
jgi:hypothetical protein